MPDFMFREGPEVSEYTWHGTELVRRHSSANEARIMAENQAIRSAGGVRTLSFGKMIMRMSLAQYRFLTKVNPALASRDKVERTKAWKRLAADGGYRNLSVEDR